MSESNYLAALSALAHEHRLRVFRLLVRHSPGGLAAGDIAAHMQLPPSSLSFHLGHLARAGLIASRREQRHIIYTANLNGMRRLLSFLTEDCCNGHPEICAELIPARRRRKAG
ncbi:MAG: metalloregulator ArsR/SmtB family transcription factor [Gammaproteobacteria bacterium]|nr:MAG: metalloregulator ArsR/SmtB family transcription factor [Gammaproteobacteria bacterium]